MAVVHILKIDGSKDGNGDDRSKNSSDNGGSGDDDDYSLYKV